MFFDELLSQLVHKTGYTPGQLARRSGLPKATIVNWMEGRVRRPRSWRGLLQLALAMRLEPADAERLLLVTGHPSLATLSQKASGPLRERLDAWQQTHALAAPPIPFQAIPDPPHFVDREAELRQLRATLLADRPGRIAVIHGMPGGGKTSLAARTAYELRDQFAAGVLWARVDISDTLAILASFAQAYGLDVTAYADVESRGRVVGNILQHRPVLLVLDGVDNPQTVRPLIPPSGKCAVLITTQRQDLAHALGALSIPLAPFDSSGDWALHYFAQIVGPDWAARERDVFRAIGARLGHLPLALALAAGRLATEPGWTAAEMERRLGSTASLWDTLTFARQNVRHSFDLTYGRLDQSLQVFLQSLGCFGPRPFTATAAAAVTKTSNSNALENLRRLYQLSLVQVPQPGLFALHSLVHEYLTVQGIPAAAQERWATYYAQLPGQTDVTWVDLTRDEAAISAALNARQQTDGELPLMALAEFQRYLQAQGRYDLAGHHIKQALDAMPPGARLRADFLLFQGQIDRHQRRYAAAAACFQASLAASHSDAQRAAAQIEFGILDNYQGEPAAAQQHLQAGLDAARAAAEPGLIIRALAENLVLQLGDPAAEAEPLLAEGLRLAQENNLAGMQSKLLRIGGTRAYLHDEYALAEQRYQAGLELAQRHGYKTDIVSFRVNLASLAYTRQDWPGCARHLEAGLAQAEALGFWYGQCLIHVNRGSLAARQGHWPAALTHYQSARIAGDLLDQKDALVHVYRGLAAANRHLGRLSTAQEHLDEAMKLAQRYNQRQIEIVLVEKIILALTQGDHRGAAQQWQELSRHAPRLAARLPAVEPSPSVEPAPLLLAWEQALQEYRPRLIIIYD